MLSKWVEQLMRPAKYNEVILSSKTERWFALYNRGQKSMRELNQYKNPQFRKIAKIANLQEMTFQYTSSVGVVFTAYFSLVNQAYKMCRILYSPTDNYFYGLATV